ncbi:hypothetical protein PIB30_067434 [Stylosanthes scabra]|uniref:Uncharacterized protein n=1 Tax=Stylosanthes scabra TaxID=79078 RepID=A0ABU6SNV5_9FABA|nr:hypothetical protein [Stylosanthes scabra]
MFRISGLSWLWTPRRGALENISTMMLMHHVVADSAILQTTMASSSSTAKMLDEHCFRTMFNQNLFEELVCRKKVTPEVTFDLEDDEYSAIKEQIELRG